MSKRALALLLVAGGLAGSLAAPTAASGGALRINHIQAEGTHNSYHVRPPWSPVVSEWDYTHSPLDVQASMEGVRGFELDVHFDGDAFRVYHIGGADEGVNCDVDANGTAFLTECLTALAQWSDANPEHHLLVVHIEPKDGDAEESIDPRAQPITGHYGELDAEIRSVMEAGRDRLVTPDDVQGSARTLREAVRTRGWPRVDDTRGQFLFVMLVFGARRVEYAGYGRPTPSLRGRVMFVEADRTDDAGPISVVTRIDDPRANLALIQQRVRSGFIVRTRADADGREARGCMDLPDAPSGIPSTEPCPVGEPDFGRLRAALDSGAQIISTDFPHGDRLGNGYSVQIEGGGPSRCNPVVAPRGCTSADIEALG